MERSLIALMGEYPDTPYTVGGRIAQLLLGVKLADGDILLNPKTDRFTGLSQGDSLIVMAFRSVDRIAEPAD